MAADRERPIEALVDLPPMADPVGARPWTSSPARVAPALFTDENLRCLVIGRMANLSLEHGNSDASCLAYALLGTVLGPDSATTRRGIGFGKLGLDLVRKARVGPLQGSCLPVARESHHPLDDAMTRRPRVRAARLNAAKQAGDLNYVGL